MPASLLQGGDRKERNTAQGVDCSLFSENLQVFKQARRNKMRDVGLPMLAAILLVVMSPLSTIAQPLPPVINEFSASTVGTDVEFVEVFGSPSTDYSAFAILEIEGDDAGAGVIDEVIAVGTTDGSGFWLRNLPANALENGTITLLLVQGFTGALGDDLDTNNDGTLDTTPWSNIIDGVSINDGGSSDITYALPVLGVSYDGFSFAPGGASRFPDGFDTESSTDWVRNDFDLAGIPGYAGSIVLGEAYNTPGASNAIFVIASPAIDLEKSTNGSDADSAPGPDVLWGTNVTWEYVVTNTGNVPLTDIEVTDDQHATVFSLSDLDPGEQQTFSLTVTSEHLGEYANIGTVTANYGDTEVTDSDPSHYTGVAHPAIDIEKYTNDEDADTPTGPEVTVGSPVTWKYVVTNTGDVPLTGIQVTDDQHATVFSLSELAPGETQMFSLTLTSEYVGQYANIGTVTANFGATVVTDSDPSHYLGIGQLCGVKYADWEGAEIPLPGWMIALWKADEAGAYLPFAVDITDADGRYCFNGLDEGYYRVSEILEEGWDQVSPVDNEHLVTWPGGADPAGYDFHNTPTKYCREETAWAADGAPGADRFVPDKGNWATYVIYSKDASTSLDYPVAFDLYAGQTNLAGRLYVCNDADTLYIKYSAFGQDDEYVAGYCGEWTGLTEYHLQVVDEFADFNPYRAANKNKGYGAPIPGQFEFKDSFDPEESETDWIEVDISNYVDGDIYIAAHAVLLWCGCDCDALAKIEAARQ